MARSCYDSHFEIFTSSFRHNCMLHSIFHPNRGTARSRSILPRRAFPQDRRPRRRLFPGPQAEYRGMCLRRSIAVPDRFPWDCPHDRCNTNRCIGSPSTGCSTGWHRIPGSRVLRTRPYRHCRSTNRSRTQNPAPGSRESRNGPIRSNTALHRAGCILGDADALLAQFIFFTGREAHAFATVIHTELVRSGASRYATAEYALVRLADFG